MKVMSKKCRMAVAIALSAYIVKNLFVGADYDESYGIMLGYRLAMGDKLLLEMWEPHQTSAIFTSLFIAPFLWLTGGVEFLNIYLRMVYFLIHGVITYFVYRTFRTCVFHEEKRDALWIALVFFAVSPKCIYIPEYSNLHIWFFTLLCLSVLWYACAESPLQGRRWLLGAAGLALVCDVLTYPSMIILFPVFFFYIWNSAVKKTDSLIFFATCILGGALFFCYILSYMTFDQVLQMIPHILRDGTHSFGFFQKIMSWCLSLGEIVLILLFTGIAAAVLTAVYCKIRHKKRSITACFFTFFFFIQTVYQFYCWFTSEFKASYPLVIYSFILLSGIYCYHKNKNTSLGNKRKNNACLYLIVISIVSYFGVMLLSNWEPIHLMPYLILGVLGGLNYLGNYLSEYIPAWKGKTLPMLCGILVFGNVFGDCKVAAASTISTPVYDENLLDYWELNPDRYPDVVVVESWFGDMRTAKEGTFIRQWLENEFQASRVTDYSYITVYYR